SWARCSTPTRKRSPAARAGSGRRSWTWISRSGRRRSSARVIAAASAAAALVLAPGAAHAQSGAGANTGAIRVTAGVDVPSVYYFRGIRQEVDPRLTLWPWGDLAITLKSSNGGLKSAVVHVGV